MLITARLAIACATALVLLVACTGTPSISPTRVPVSTGFVAPTPAAGRAVFVGRIVGKESRAPIKRTYVYLAQVYRDASGTQSAFAVDIARSPATISDREGLVVFTDVEPGDYVIVVGDFYGKNDTVREVDGKPKVVAIGSGDVLDLGLISVDPELELNLPE